MSATLAQKLVAHAAGRDAVAPGEIVMCKVDLAMSHDSSGPRRVGPMLEQLGVTDWHRDKYVVITDHFVPTSDEASAAILRYTRQWISDQGIERFYDGQGICHVVLPERGHVKPGMFIVGSDSHSTTSGALGAYAFAVGTTELVGALVTGEIWLQVPETLLIEWSGRFGVGVCAKDVMLYLCGRLGLNGGRYHAIEYGGAAIRALSMQERLTLGNMTAELGAQVGLIAPDAVTADYLAAAGVRVDDWRSEWACWHTDADAVVLERHDYDAANLEPQVAAPHSPANTHGIDAIDRERIDIAYIGACTGAKLDDLRMAAQVLKGRRAAPGVTLMVAPASLRDRQVAQDEGTLDVLQSAGAQMLASSCGACAGYGGFLFPEETRVVSSTARNFKGRMGAASSRVWLASPYTVAASAVTGVLSDPREFLQ